VQTQLSRTRRQPYSVAPLLLIGTAVALGMTRPDHRYDSGDRVSSCAG